MSFLKLLAFVSLLATLCAAWTDSLLPAQPSPPARTTDRYGDPLPQGAIARLGTIRLRASSQKISFAPDGKTMASGGGTLSPMICIWDVATGKELRQCKGHTGRIASLFHSADGKTLVSASTDGSLRLWEEATGRELRSIKVNNFIRAVALTENGAVLVAVENDWTVRVVDVAKDKELARFGEHRANEVQVVLSPAGNRFATFGKDEIVAVWDIPTAKLLCRIATQQKSLGVGGVGAVAFAADGNSLATVGKEPAIVQWDAATGKEMGRFNGATGLVRDLAFSPDGRRLVATSSKSTLHVWGVATRQELRQFDLGSKTAVNATFSPDSKLVAAVQGEVIRLWDLAANKELHDFGGITSEVTDLCFTPDGRFVLTCEDDGTARRWETATGKQTAVWNRPVVLHYKMLALSDGNSVITPSPKGISRVELRGGSGTAATLVTSKTRLICQAVSADGTTLAGTGTDNMMTFWNAVSGREIGLLKGSQASYHVFALSAEGALLAACSPNQPVRIWDVAEGRQLVQFDVKNEIKQDKGAKIWTMGTNFVKFTPDGKSLLTVSNQVFLWEVATGRQRVSVSQQGSAGAISPDGCLAAVGTHACAVVVFDTATGKELAKLEGHRSRVECLAFAPTGKTLASGSADTTVLIWDVAALADKAKPALLELKPEQLADRWKGLADADVVKAYKALCTLSAAPKQTAAFLKTRVLGVDAALAQRVAQLIRDLEDNKFAVREKAQGELAALEDLPLPALQKALEGKPSAELRVRAETVLGKIPNADVKLYELRMFRALEALERSATRDAIGFLELAAKSAADPRVQRAAEAAVQRLSRRVAFP